MENQKISDLKAWDQNPRTVTEEKLSILKKTLDEFGDLSGFVYNVRLGALVGGHMRQKNLMDAKIEIVHRHKKPTSKGTVAYGYAVHDGERYNYREVDWDVHRHEAASIAANNSAGDWEWTSLKSILTNLEAAEFDVTLTGFNFSELDTILGDKHGNSSPDYSILEGAGETDVTLGAMTSGVKKAIQIEFEKDDYAVAYELIRHFRERGIYVGGLLIEKLKHEKDGL